MAITIQGIRVDSLSISNDEKEDKVTGSYSLLSNVGKVLAKQAFNGYNDIKVSFSVDTQKALSDFLKGVREDLNVVLGLE